MSSLTAPDVRFVDGVPYSDTFQDVYYSRQNGLAESRQVYLQANGLPERWRGYQIYTIAETGFGSGLNFLATWDLWRRTSNRSEILHFISIEKYPMEKHLLEECHREFPGLARYSHELVEHYPLPIQGFHRVWLDQHRVCLTLCLDDVATALKQLSAEINCWFLDGFAPARNPEMWTRSVFRQIARLSCSNTTLSTFTASGLVRRGLEDSGFEVSKISGYGNKKQMIVARFKHRVPYREPEPWFRNPVPTNHSQSAVVIGSGIAGAQAAWHLAQRGWQVEVIERHNENGIEASGNPMAVVCPKVTAGPSIEESFSIQCFQYLQEQLRCLGLDRDTWSTSGVLQLACSQVKREQWKRIAKRKLNPLMLQCLSADEASDVAGIWLEYAAVYYPSGGWIAPRGLIRRLLQHSAITVSNGFEAECISREKDQWQIFDRHNACLAKTKILVIASGRNLSFKETATIPNTPVLGQTTYARATNSSRRLNTVIQHDGYITPAHDGNHLLGATFQRNVSQPTYHADADEENLHRQKVNISRFSATLGEISSAHAAIRITSSNRMPVLGAVPVESALRNNYRPMLRKNYSEHPSLDNYFPGLYITAAYGSRGMTNAALGGELLASIICNEALPIQTRIFHCVHPARHIIRDLKQHPAS